MKNIYIGFTFLVILIISCTFKQNQVNNCIPRPFTPKENKLKDSLLMYYDSILIERYDNYSCDAFNGGEYNVTIKYVSKDEIFEENALREKAKNLAINLYNRVIEENIL